MHFGFYVVFSPAEVTDEFADLPGEFFDHRSKSLLRYLGGSGESLCHGDAARQKHALKVADDAADLSEQLEFV